MTAHLVQHLVRRGFQAAQDHMTRKQALVHHLEEDAELYEKSGQSVEGYELLPMIITAFFALFIICSIEYTLGQVMASLAMIETPTSTAIVEPKPPAYADQPEALDVKEKEPLMPAEAEADVEITVINHKPITAKIVTTIGHLHRIGGFSARWRGIGNAALYNMVHGFFTHGVATLLGLGVCGEILAHIFASVALSRLHMAWTMKMIAYPSNKAWFRRLPSFKDSKPLLLPNFVYACAQQLTLVLPIGVAFLLGVAGPPHMNFDEDTPKKNCANLILIFLSFLAVPATYIASVFVFLIPASVALVRVEAALLPEEEQTIVPFDKTAMLQDIDLSARGGRRALFVQAWRSFDRASRWKLIKLYAKIIMAQVTVAFVAVHVIFAEFYLLGAERIQLFIKSGVAQVKLMAIEAHEHAQ